MYGAIIHAPGDVRYEERPDPTLLETADAIIRTTAACVCGSDLWRYRGLHGAHYEGCQAEQILVPLADGTLVKTPSMPDDDLIPSLLTLSDVVCTGWHAAVSAGVGPGSSVAVVGDGAVGLCGVIAAAQLGATTIIAMSRHADCQEVARESGATHIVAERDEAGVEAVKALTDGIGADCVLAIPQMTAAGTSQVHGY